MIVQPNLPALLAALAQDARRVAGLVRAAPGLDRPVPGLQWTAAQLAAHLSVVYQAFAGTIRGDAFEPGLLAAIGAGETLPQVLTATNARVVETVRFAGPAEAADTLSASAAGLADALAAAPDLDTPRPTPWYGSGLTRTVGTLAGIALSETLVHGRDLALALGGDPRVPAASARIAAPTVLSAMLPLLVDPVATRGLRAGFGVRVRGGAAFTLRIEDGKARTEPYGGPVDTVISLAPAAALLVSFNRMPVGRAILTAAAVSYGRKPWLGLRFRSLFQNP